MKRFNFVLLTVLLLLVFYSAGFAITPENGFVPKWHVGQRWVLEAKYRDMRTPGNVWMPPIRWVFKVRAIKDMFRQKCYVVQVYPQKSTMRVQAILWLAVNDLRPLKVIDIFSVGGKIKSRVRDDINPFSPAPLIAENSIVPYDMPVFPLIRKDTSRQMADGFDAYKTEPEAKKYSSVAKVGGLSFKRVFKQSNQVPDRQHADAFAAYAQQKNTGETFQVEIATDKSGAGITQLWQEGLPWAVKSESRDKIVTLLPGSAPTPLPSDDDNGGEE